MQTSIGEKPIRAETDRMYKQYWYCRYCQYNDIYCRKPVVFLSKKDIDKEDGWHTILVCKSFIQSGPEHLLP